MAAPSAPVTDMGGGAGIVVADAAPHTSLPPPTMAPFANGHYDTTASLPSAQPLPSSAHFGAGLMPSSVASAASRSVKRPRPVKSCTECRKRKLKCDRHTPCAQCQKSHRICKYPEHPANHDTSALSDGSDTEEVQRPAKRSCPPAGPGSSASVLQATPTFSSARYAEPSDPPTLEVLASRVDRLEHAVLSKGPYGDLDGGMRLKLRPELIRGLSVKDGAERTRLFGQGSVRVLINLFPEAKDFLSHHVMTGDFVEVMPALERLHLYLQEDLQRLLTPMPVYVTSATPVQNRMKHILTKLPGRDVCDRLLGSYISTTEAIYRFIHIPTFMGQYERYWENGMDSDAFLCQFLLIMAVGSRFVTESKGLDPNVVDGVHIPTACELVRSWLYSLTGKQLVDFATLQTEALLLHTQRMIATDGQELWTQTGTLVRSAMRMGMHRDPSEFGHQIPVFAGELRRRLWFTILEIDIHVSLVCNLRCAVEEEDFTCQLPRNLDDADLTPDMVELPPSKPMDHHTTNQIQSYAARTLGTRLKIIHLVSRIDSLRDFSGIMELGARMERYFEDVNLLYPRDSSLGEPEWTNQWRSRVILDMHVRRPLLALYRPFALGASNPPAQITQAYLRSSLVILGYLDEVDPRMQHFHNVSDMYHQVLKKDMLQASLSLCYYIKAGLQQAAANGSTLGPGAAAPSPSSHGDSSSPFLNKAEAPALFSPGRLIKVVEKAMALLMRNVGGSDVKDLIALAVVFASVQTTSQERGLQEIKRALSILLDTCLAATKTSLDKIMSSAARDGDGRGPYMQGRPPYMAQAGVAGPQQTGVGESSGGWRLWHGWDFAD